MRVPRATYRLQFHRGFTFKQARALLPYLDELGVSDVYASPIFPAPPESNHGYDICAFDQINSNLGSNEEFEELVSEIRQRGMGLLLDMVPNHMGTHASNPWWMDVLKNGRRSPFAKYFDINWSPPNSTLNEKVLLPVLGDDYSKVLSRGEINIIEVQNNFYLAYFNKRFPISPESVEEAARFQNPNHAAEQEDRLKSLIDKQHYHLAHWRTGQRELNYRRFFDVNELVSLRMEDEEVFDKSHCLAFELLRTGRATGLRIDHSDGLRDPKKYFERLQTSGNNNAFIVAEKILTHDERLPDDWPIAGTVGYDFLNLLNGLFIQTQNEEKFTRIYEKFTSAEEPFGVVAYRSKREIIELSFISEVNSLTNQLKKLAEVSRHDQDLATHDIRSATVNLIAGLPVYRTYLQQQTKNISLADRRFIQRGIDEAKKQSPDVLPSLQFLSRILQLEFSQDLDSDGRNAALELVIRLQQLTGAASAKGIEDTAFYRYTRFVSLNEVGGDPGRFGIQPDAFHAHNQYQQEQWPTSLLATSTHDTKRGEDTRARLNVLSEIPEIWEKCVFDWRALNTQHKSGSGPAPSDEYLLYQTLVGTWQPDGDFITYRERIQAYLTKAIREAKANSSWTDVNDDYENSVREFVSKILTSHQFIESLTDFSDKIAYFGVFNSLAQVVLKVCSPGVPDFYQGTELWDLTLVDPDNRRNIDYSQRQDILRNLHNSSPSDLLKNWRTGEVKLFTMLSALRARKTFLEAFCGDYCPLPVTGSQKEHMIAFSRKSAQQTIVAAVPRFVRTLVGENGGYPSAEIWADTQAQSKSSARFRNLFTGEEHDSLRAASLFATFPVAILVALD